MVREEIIMPGQTSRADRASEFERIERLVEILDSWFAIPGTNVRVGLDAVVGLAPGVGDAVMLLASLHVSQRLAALGLPAHVRMRMYGNVAIDFLVGAIPVLGDFFDIAFKANARNLELARRHLGL